MSFMTSVRVCSYNIGDIGDIKNLMNKVLGMKPNIICFQEYKKDKYEQIVRELKSEGYTAYKTDTLIIFTRIPPIKTSFITFTNTKQNRGVMIHTYNLRKYEKTDIDGHEVAIDTPIVIATGILEKGGSGNRDRKQQIYELYNILKTEYPVIFIGDTNIPLWQEDLPEVPQSHLNLYSFPTWKDAWSEKGTSNNEYTVIYPGNSGDRMDRAWYTGLQCQNYNIVNTDTTTDRKGIIVEFS